MQSGALTADERFIPKTERNILTDPPKSKSNEPYEKPMTKGELAEIAELRETVHNTSAAVHLMTKMMNQSTQGIPVTNGAMGAWSRTFVTIAVVFIGWIFTSLYIAKTTETEIRVSNAILTEQLRETREKLDEYRKETSLKIALADERYRQISIAMESRGVKMPTQ